MPQPCRICNHPEREAIDAELSRDWERSLRSIGQAYGVSKDSLLRHSQVHLRVIENGGLTDAEDRATDCAEIRAQENMPADEARQVAQVAAHEKSDPASVPEDKPLSELDRVLAMFATRQSASRR